VVPAAPIETPMPPATAAGSAAQAEPAPAPPAVVADVAQLAAPSVVPSSSSKGHIKAQIYVDNLPTTMNEDQFRMLFKPFGELASCKFLKHRSGL